MLSFLSSCANICIFGLVLTLLSVAFIASFSRNPNLIFYLNPVPTPPPLPPSLSFPPPISGRLTAYPPPSDPSVDLKNLTVSEKQHINDRYLQYAGSGDFCAGVGHYTWSLSCALGEAKYLNRTFLIDDYFCVHPVHNVGKMSVQKFSLYFDVPRMKRSVRSMEKSKFYDIQKQIRSHGFQFETKTVDAKFPTSKMRAIKSTLIQRQFKVGEYGYQICEREKAIERPWSAVGYSPLIMDLVWHICGKLKWDFDTVHIRRGDKLGNKKAWPHLDVDTRPPKLTATIKKRIAKGRRLYISTNERNISIFKPLSSLYSVRTLNDFQYLWARDGDWWNKSRKLLGSSSLAEASFDGAMKGMVDYEVFGKGKVRLETFNDLTSDKKNGNVK